ncbi:hypothetical protein GGS26DRAFT_589336 [Hypomontagnella submonticulosa]|nr:hypothetical protein GGS26DRAFT_589336 [Hypomontagnella submonticulosa]
MLTRCTRIAKEEAIKLGYTHVWMRAKNHDFKSQWSTTGEKFFVPSQPHVTVVFGPSASHIHWEGHIWTKNLADGSKAPQRRLEPSEVDEDGGNPQLYSSGPYPYTSLPDDYPHPFKLRPDDNLVVYKMPPPYFYSEPQELE